MTKQPDYILPELEIEYLWATKYWDYPRAGLCKIDGHICYFIERITDNDDTCYVIEKEQYTINGTPFEDDRTNYLEVINYWCWKLPFWLCMRFLLEKKIMGILWGKNMFYPERRQLRKLPARKPNKLRDWLRDLYYKKTSISENFHKKIDQIYFVPQE